MLQMKVKQGQNRNLNNMAHITASFLLLFFPLTGPCLVLADQCSWDLSVADQSIFIVPEVDRNHHPSIPPSTTPLSLADVWHEAAEASCLPGMALRSSLSPCLDIVGGGAQRPTLHDLL